MRRYFLAFILLSLLGNTSFSREAKDEKVVIQSDKINKNNNNVITAIGDVEVKRGSSIFNAQEVEYNQNTKTIKANSEVRVYDEQLNNLFFSETAEIKDDFTEAHFENGIVVFENGSSIRGLQIDKINEKNIKLEKVKYAVCPTDLYDKDLTYEKIMAELEKRKNPLFSLRSSSANANNEAKILSLWGTSVWLWKIPIFYIPYFKTGYVFNTHANGFDIPGIENTSHYGYGVYMPYKINMAQQKLVITPRVYQKGNFLFNTNYKATSIQENKWKINLNGDVTNDNGQSKNLKNAYGVTEEEEGNYKKWRGFAESDGYYNFNDIWGFDHKGAILGDRYYYRDYYQDGTSYIESNFRFTRVNLKNDYDFNHFQFSNLFYQELLDKNSNYNAPRYAPVTNSNLQDIIVKNDYNNLFYKINLNTTNLFRKKGVEYNRLTLTPSLNNTFNTDFGTINSSIELRSDAYILNEVGYKPGLYDGTESRLLPQFNIEWRNVLVANNFLFQPILKYSINPKSDGFERDIPNEDSKPQAISFENIFSNNRFIGYDRQEYGNRVTYGFESLIFNDFGFGLAQGYRDNTNADNDKYLFGFEDDVSDYVGYLSYIFNDYFDINYRFLTDKDNFNFKKNEVVLNFMAKNFNMYTIYTDIKHNHIYKDRQRQLNVGAYLTIFSKWKFNASGIVDLTSNNRILESKLGFVYDGNCARWGISYKNRNPMSETTRSTSIDFNLTLKFI